MARRVKLRTDLGDVRPHTAKVFEEFAERFVIHFAWGIGATGDHARGKALDLMAYELGGGVDNPGPIRKGWNRTVAHYAWANRRRLGIDYVIYDQLIISTNPDGYAYGGPDGATWHHYPGQSHANHVHISFEENPPAYRPPGVDVDQEEGMQLDDMVKLPGWAVRRWPDDSGVADGKIAVNTALGSGYGHARLARENTTKILALVEAQSAAIEMLVDALALPAADVEALKAVIREAFARISIRFESEGGSE